MNFTFNYTADDYWAAQKLFIRRSQLTNAKLTILLITDLIFAGLAFWLAWHGEWFVSLIWLAALTVILYIPFAVRARFKKEFLGQKNLQLPLEIQISEEGFHSKNSIGEGHMKWENFGSWMEDSSMMMILAKGSRLFYMFPKRLLTSEQIEDVRRLFSMYIQP